MTKHTPGPWLMSEEHGAHVYSEAENMQIADILICEASDPEPYATTDGEVAKANAQLISAAPDLLEAVRRLLDCPALNLDDLEPEDESAIIYALAAIAKARGEAQEVRVPDLTAN